jgi:hypothetical protein
MLDEHALTAPVAGTSGFADAYSARGPHDKRRRSLPARFEPATASPSFSPLIYSEQFAGLPAEVREYIYQRIQAVLTGRDRSDDFASVSDAERAAILEILRETLPEMARHL